MPKKPQRELHESANVWGATDPIEVRFRELAHEVRALRQEMADDRKHRRLGHERLPKHPDTTHDTPQGRFRKRKT